MRPLLQRDRRQKPIQQLNARDNIREGFISGICVYPMATFACSIDSRTSFSTSAAWCGHFLPTHSPSAISAERTQLLHIWRQLRLHEQKLPTPRDRAVDHCTPYQPRQHNAG